MIIRSYGGLTPRIGARVFIAENATVIGDVEIGDDASIWYGAVLRADIHAIRIGARTNVQDNCTIHVTAGTWPTILADEVTLGHGVIAHGCTVETHCLIGMGATILDGAVVGEETLVGAGALVTEGMKIPPRSLVLGVPGRVIRRLTPEEVERIQLNFRSYLEYKDAYLAARLEAGDDD
ncbi:MAG TPA: gamma carbonic anhydrase family protein [Thermoanaerobaculia bacterium]|nr:gamma carbonic anhydrase family protein [Thermoanaerobaculia bacterium]